MPPQRKRRTCQYCDREFTKHEHLVRHENSHTGTRPYACPTCPKTFGRKDVLNRHQRKCRGDEGADGEGDESTDAYPAAGPSNSFPAMTADMMQAGPSHLPAPVPSAGPPPFPTMQPRFATASLNFAASTNYDPFSADLDALFGEVLTNLPSMHDSAFWTEFDGNTSDHHSLGSPSLLPDVVSPGSSAHGEAALDRIGDKWPKLPRPRNELQKPTRSSSGNGWTGAYAELKSGIEFAPIEPPSTAFLAASVHHFFRDWQKDHPFINEANFAPHQHNPLLVLAMCASGARYMSSSQAAGFAAAVFERMLVLLHRNWAETDERATQLDFIRAALLLQIYCLSSGNQRLIGQAAALQGTIVAQARRSLLLSPGGPVDFRHEETLQWTTLTMTPPQTVDDLWKSWVEVEEARRIVAMILHTEAYLHSLIREAAPPYFAPVSVHIVLPSDETGDAFAAKDAYSWSTVIQARGLRANEKLIDLIRRLYQPAGELDVPTPLSVYALRFQLDAMYQQERCRRLSILPNEDGTIPSDSASLVACERWRKHYLDKALQPNAAEGQWRLFELQMTWNAHCLSHLLDLVGLELAHGKEGHDASIEPRRRLDALRGTPALHRALLHAGNVLGLLARVPRGTSAGLPMFTICFKSALLLATFCANMGATSALSLSDLADWGQIGLAGVEGFSSPPTYPDTLRLSPAVHFIWYGGAWSVNNLHTSADILNWTATALHAMGGASKPIGPVLATILSMRAQSW